MNLDLKLVLKAGFIWGIVGVLLILALTLLPFLSGLESVGVLTYVAMFAGVHFAARDPGSWLVALIGGAIAGIIAALLVMVAGFFLGGGSFDAMGLVGAVVAGLAGALGMRVVQKV